MDKFRKKQLCKILGLSEDVSDEEVLRLCRQYIKANHPDVTGKTPPPHYDFVVDAKLQEDKARRAAKAKSNAKRSTEKKTENPQPNDAPSAGASAQKPRGAQSSHGTNVAHRGHDPSAGDVQVMAGVPVVSDGDARQYPLDVLRKPEVFKAKKPGKFSETLRDPSAIQLIEAEPGAWKLYLDRSLYNYGRGLKFVGYAAVALCTISAVPVLGVAACVGFYAFGSMAQGIAVGNAVSHANFNAAAQNVLGMSGSEALKKKKFKKDPRIIKAVADRTKPGNYFTSSFSQLGKPI